MSWVGIDAKIGEEASHWPKTGPTEKVEGPRTVSESFKVSFKIGSWKMWTENVVASINIRVCGGICSGYAIDATITFKKSTAPPTTTKPTPAKKPPPRVKACANGRKPAAAALGGEACPMSWEMPKRFGVKIKDPGSYRDGMVEYFTSRSTIDPKQWLVPRATGAARRSRRRRSRRRRPVPP